MLPLERLLTHTGIFGPSGSGKSATFYMNMLRDWSEYGSALSWTSRESSTRTRRVTTITSIVWTRESRLLRSLESLPRCLGNGELAHSIASIVVSYEPEKCEVNENTHYWLSGETALMRALCLHMPTIAANPTLPMIKEYLSRNDLKKLG
jgi:hypothetical protein